MYLDATKRFPFDSATFDYILCEHMIEHVAWREGLDVLRECHRVLKPGGTVRVATPDLEVLVSLHGRSQNETQARFIEWVTDRYLPQVGAYKAAFVINNSFHNWGHQLLYDGDLMEFAMRQSGFTNIKRCVFGESDDENLRGIESHGRNIGDDAMAAFETLVFEGKRPDRTL
jgi:predicted SAM-dependent methyltransferase